MSRIRIPLDDPDNHLLVGYDRAFKTYFAMLYTPAGDARRVEDEPDKACGYHPMERSAREITEHGPYPCDLDALDVVLHEWGLSQHEIETAVTLARQDGPAG